MALLAESVKLDVLSHPAGDGEGGEAGHGGLGWCSRMLATR